MNPQNTHRTPGHQSFKHDADTAPLSDFQVNHAPRPRSAYKRHKQKRQTNYVLMAGIVGLALVGLLVVLIVPSNPTEMVRQPVIADADITPEAPKASIILAGSVASATGRTHSFGQQYGAIDTLDGSRIQVLLNEFERGLEGDLMNELLESKAPSQSSRQFIDLFATADHKKVFLHSFSWKPVQNGFYGEGEFLARFQFIDQNQWVTRKGKTSMTLSNRGAKLLIEQFHFEDNLH